MNKYAVYVICDADGKEIARGTTNDLIDKGIVRSKTKLGTYAYFNTKLYGKYIVKKGGFVWMEKSEYEKDIELILYGLFDDEGKEVARGTNLELANQGYCSRKRNLSSWVKNNVKLQGKYSVVPLGIIKKDGTIADYVPKKKTITELDYLSYHLNKFGNTFTRKNPAIYCDELHKMGIDINITRMKDSRGVGYLVDKV